jgi:inner membrane protein
VLKNHGLHAVHYGLVGLSLPRLSALLYGIVLSEDYALLGGSLLVFGVLGVVMVRTRSENWAGFGRAGIG